MRVPRLSVLAIALAIGSSLVYGLSDFLGGLKSRSVALLPVLLVSQGSALIVPVAIVMVSGAAPPGATYLVYAALAGVSEAAGVAALYRGLASGVISIVAPVAAAAPLFPVAAGILLGELPAPIQAAGVGLAVGGIVLTACERSAGRVAAGAVGPSVAFGLLSRSGSGASTSRWTQPARATSRGRCSSAGDRGGAVRHGLPGQAEALRHAAGGASGHRVDRRAHRGRGLDVRRRIHPRAPERDRRAQLGSIQS